MKKGNIFFLVLILCLFLNINQVKAEDSNNNSCVPTISGERRYKVFFNTNEGSAIEPLQTTIPFGDEASTQIILPTPTREGYTFEGWYKDEPLNTKVAATNFNELSQLENENNEECSSDFIVTLYAKWVKNTCIPPISGARRYKVVFNVNDGNELDPIEKTIQFGDEASTEITLPTPTKEGYTFEGWYKDESLNTKVEITNYSEISQLENENNEECSNEFIITLYAKWEHSTTTNPKTGIISSSVIIIIATFLGYSYIKKKDMFKENIKN